MSLVREWLAGGLLIADGAWGTELQARGLKPGAAPDNGRYLYEEMSRYRSRYGRLTFIETGLEADGIFVAEAAAEATDKGWSFERLRGDLAWLRRLVGGNRAETEFVVAEPGQRITASYDALVVKRSSP
ncbi:MAG: hypothetical protein WBL61_22515 [Bryobacteraceae bacterium]